MWKKLWPIIPVAAVLVVWEVVSRSHIVSPALFPPPSSVAAALGASTTRETLASDLASSMGRLLLGLGLGCGVGILIGLATGRIKKLDRAIAPLIHML